ncbi:hypothetical protein GCM10010435_23700 [Winogradskya consettensis]|uniref:Uncharacterized protein n=1 Tax=Winogradskya consettensis TaxID=113560 RepID=A0A919T0Z4_9ACTN|nr:DUF6188 family protein [Actinoplanes consettensis]GIM82357.1 hypothetical protein Aco04nite_81100 [Actinoplanes consettensis]
MLSVLDADTDAGRRPRQARRVELLDGRKLEYVQLGHAVELGFSGGFRVLIESLAHLNTPRGRVEVEPGADASDVVATLLGDDVRSARTGAGNELRICFVSGSELVVGADADVESWAITGPDGSLTVCLARGELACWG